MEILIVGAIIMFILIYNNTIDKDKFFADNQKYLEALNLCSNGFLNSFSFNCFWKWIC